MKSYEMQERMVADSSTPIPFIAPEGWWNDVNGAVFLERPLPYRIPSKISNGDGERDFQLAAYLKPRSAPLATAKLLLVNRLKV